MPITNATRWLCQISSSISLPTVPVSWRLNRGDRVQWYVVVWLALLGAILVALPKVDALRLVLLALALYRLQDLLFAVVDDALGMTCRSDAFQEPKEPLGTKLLRAPIAILLTNVVQLIVVFAIAFEYVNLTSGGADVVRPTCHIGTSTAVCSYARDLGPFDYLALSWTSLFTLGNGDLIVGTGGQVFVMLEVASSLIVVGTGLATFIARSLTRTTALPVETHDGPPLPCGRLLGRRCRDQCQIIGASRPRAPGM